MGAVDSATRARGDSILHGGVHDDGDIVLMPGTPGKKVGMKRGLERSEGGGVGSSLTPSKPSSRRVVPPPLKSIAKKPKQGSIRRFCIPAGVQDEKETPVLFPRQTARDASWSSGVRKLERLAVRDSAQRELRCPNHDATTSTAPTTSAFAVPAAADPVIAASPGGGGIADEFFISCTQDYERGSQAVMSPDLLPCVTQEPSFRFQQSQASHTEEFFGGSMQLSVRTQTAQVDTTDNEQLCTQPETQTQAEIAPEPVAAALGDTHATTPDLGMFSSTESSSSLAKPLFNIFLPKSEQRHLIIIRHGQSEFNRAVEEGPGFKDPMIFDPPLTPKGREQARALREKLRHEVSVHGDALWVVSPLRRAIETFLLACPLIPDCRAGKGSEAGTRSDGDALMSSNLELLPLISEFCVTAGDVGTKASALARDFPQLAHKLVKLPETWWFQEPHKPNCAAAENMNSMESRAHQKQRVGEFTRWLSKRPEKFIILVGHCSFWKEFSRASDPMKNGEMRRMHW